MRRELLQDWQQHPQEPAEKRSDTGRTCRDSSLIMNDALIQRCYTSGGNGGIQSERESRVTAASSTVTNCHAIWGGGICTKTGHKAELIGCAFTGNRAPRGCAIQTFKGEGEIPLVIRNCTITGNRFGEKIHAGGTICYMSETGIILSGKIVMEDNLSAGYEPCDIHYFYNTGASILLDEDFESITPQEPVICVPIRTSTPERM